MGAEQDNHTPYDGPPQGGKSDSFFGDGDFDPVMLEALANLITGEAAPLVLPKRDPDQGDAAPRVTYKKVVYRD